MGSGVEWSVLVELIPFGVFSWSPISFVVGDAGMGRFVLCIWMGMGVASHCMGLV